MTSVKDRIAQLENRAKSPGLEGNEPATEPDTEPATEPDTEPAPTTTQLEPALNEPADPFPGRQDLIDRTTTVDSNEVSEQTISSLGTDLNPEGLDDFAAATATAENMVVPPHQGKEEEQQAPPPTTPAPTPAWLAKAPAQAQKPWEVDVAPPAASPSLSWLEKAPSQQQQQPSLGKLSSSANLPPWLAKANEIRAKKAAAQNASSSQTQVSSPVVKVDPVVIPDVPMPDAEEPNRPAFMEQSPKPCEEGDKPGEEGDKPTFMEPAPTPSPSKGPTPMEVEPSTTANVEQIKPPALDGTELARQVSDDSIDDSKNVMMPLPPLAPKQTSLPPRPKSPPRPVAVANVVRTPSPLLDSGVSHTSSLTGPDAFDVAMKQSDGQDNTAEEGGQLWQRAERDAFAAARIAELERTIVELEQAKAKEMEDKAQKSVTPAVADPIARGEEASQSPSMTTMSTGAGVSKAFDMAIEKSQDFEPPQAQSGESGGRLWSEAAKKETIVPGVLKSPNKAGKPPVSGGHMRSDSPAQSLATNTTVGIGTFEKLRADTPDAFDKAIAKCEEENPFPPVEQFKDEPMGGDEAAMKEKNKLYRSLIQSSQASPRAAPVSNPASKSSGAVVTLEETPVKGRGPFKSVKSPQKRRYLVQFLIVGIWVTVVGMLGNIYLGFSCYFASAPIEVGAYEVEIDLRYGLWVYSPLQSAMTGFPYCNRYDENHEAPLIPQIFHLCASATGMFSLFVMWYYLIAGRIGRCVWTCAVWSSFLATILQLLMLLFFALDTCEEATCSWGVGSSVVLVTAFAWFILAIELNLQYRNLGIQSVPQSEHVEMTAMRSSGSSKDYAPPSIS